MLLHHRLDIEEAKAVAFHFMQVAGGHAIELVEYVRLAVAGNADAVVGDVDFCISLTCDKLPKFLKKYA